MNKQLSNRRISIIVLALIFVSPSALYSLHYIGIHHHYHPTSQATTFDAPVTKCLVHDFVLFSFLREPLLHYQQPLFSFEIISTQGKVSPQISNHIALIKTRGPPITIHVSKKQTKKNCT